MERKDKVLLIADGSNLFWRSYHGLSYQQLNFQGNPTWAVFGVINTMADAIKHHSPTHVLITFDYGKSLYRKEIYPEYKAGRHLGSTVDYDDVQTQMAQTQKLLEDIGVPIWKEYGVEADDVVATVVERFEDKMDEIIILSGDHDLRQLVSRKTIVVHPSLGKKEEKIWDLEGILEHYEMPPSRLPEIWGMSGDPGDNIPGAKGIGEKTAIKFLKKYGNIGQVVLSDEPRIQDYIDDIHMSYKLVQLNPDLSTIYFDLDDLEFNPIGPNDPGAQHVKEVLQGHGFDRILNRWNTNTLWADRGIRLKDIKTNNAE